MNRFEAHGPMAAMLHAGQGAARFHMPGHKGRIDPFDMTEIARTDDLYAPYRGILEAERLAARACGAAHFLMLTGGSTAGLMAMLLSCVPPGAKLLLQRNAHHAALSACVWGDIQAVFAKDIAEALGRNPGVCAALITRPDYYGRCPDLAPIVKAARQTGALVLVDEAHGAHFPWWDCPQSAGRLGADAWVQSSHKTLPALTGAAWLHLAGSLDPCRARRFLRMVQTSSPPFPILASLDGSRAWMDANGRQALAGTVALLEGFRARLAALSGYADVKADDPTRLVIGTRGRGYTGLDAQARLSSLGVDVEMADDSSLVLVCTVADTKADFDRLFDALAAIARRDPLPPVSVRLPEPGPTVLPLRLAALSPQEPVALAKAAGRVASVSAGMYPPGTPALLPGEIITPAAVAWLESLPPERRFGVENDALICVRGGDC